MIVGGAGAFPFEMTVPGGTVATAGVTVVGTFPTHRRRGVLRSMMRAQLDDVHARGEPAGAPVGVRGDDLRPVRLRDGVDGRAGLDSEGVLELRTALRARGHRAARRRRRGAHAVPARVEPGAPAHSGHARAFAELVGVSRPLRAARAAGGRPKRYVVLERDGRPEGYAVYRHKPKWEDGDVGLRARGAWRRSRSTASRPRSSGATSSTSTGRRGSEPACCRSTIRSGGCSRRRRRMRPRIGDGLWVRLVDVGAALSARSYAADGAVVLDVADEFCPWNDGRWRVTSRGAEADDVRGAASAAT